MGYFFENNIYLHFAMNLMRTKFLFEILFYVSFKGVMHP